MKLSAVGFKPNDIGFYLLLIAIFSLPFQTIVAFNLLGRWVYLTDIFWVLTLLASVGLFSRGKLKYRWSAFEGVLFLHFVALSLSTIFSDDPVISLVFLIRGTYMIVIAASTRAILSSVPRLNSAITAWLMGALITIVASFWGIFLFYSGLKDPAVNNFLSHYGSLPPGNYPRILGLFSGCNKYCGYLVITLAFAWYRSITRPRGYWHLLMLFALLVVSAFTFSPALGGAALVLALSGKLLSPRCANKWIKTFGINLIFILGIAGAVLFFLAALVSPIALIQGEIAPSPRLMTWKAALETIRSYPVFGLGLGFTGFEVEYFSASGDTQYLTQAHNVWLGTGATTGIVGILALGSLVIYLYKDYIGFAYPGKDAVMPSCLRNEGEVPDHKNRNRLAEIRLTFAIALAGGFLFYGLVETAYSNRFLWVLFGMCAASVANFPRSN